jgi:L-ribulose-5-phosphate 4-epimerase
MGMYDQEQKEVLNCAKWLSEHGYFGGFRGSGGNISVKVDDQNIIAITPSGRPYWDMSFEDISVVDFDLKPVDAKHAPSKEAGMHAAIYQHRSDVKAVVHTHQTYASIFSIINQSIPALFDEIANEIGAVIEIVPYAISGSAELAQNVADRLGNQYLCYILQNHGALSLGTTIDQAWKNTELLEKAAQVYYHALMTGREISRLPRETINYFNEKRKSG